MNEKSVKVNPLGAENINKLIARFAIPAIISMVVNAAYNIIDQVLIGWSSVGMLGIAADRKSTRLNSSHT